MRVTVTRIISHGNDSTVAFGPAPVGLMRFSIEYSQVQTPSCICRRTQLAHLIPCYSMCCEPSLALSYFLSSARCGVQCTDRHPPYTSSAPLIKLLGDGYVLGDKTPSHWVGCKKENPGLALEVCGLTRLKWERSPAGCKLLRPLRTFLPRDSRSGRREP